MSSTNQSVHLAAALLLCGLLGSAARADELDEPDVTGGGSIDVITWEPILSAFYVVPRAGGGDDDAGFGAGEFRQVEAKPGLAQAWRELRDKVSVRGSVGFGPSEPVCSGWRVAEEGERAGIGFLAHMATGGGAGPQTMLDVQPVTVYIALDVLMSADESTREALWPKFRVLEESLTAHGISTLAKDPSAYRAAIPVWSQAGTLLFSGGSPTEAQGTDLPVVTPGTRLLPRGEYRLPSAGAYELRYTARVRFRADAAAEDSVKTIQAAIRVAVVATGTNVTQLSFQPLTPLTDAPKPPGEPRKR